MSPFDKVGGWHTQTSFLPIKISTALTFLFSRRKNHMIFIYFCDWI